MKRYYLDTCIWRDYFENRSDRFRPLGEWAFRLIKRIIEENGFFVISNHLLNELSKEYSLEELEDLFDIVPKNLIFKINCKKEQTDEAFELKNKMNIPFGDALHWILSRDSNAVLISRDKHFYELQDIVIVKKPEELI